MATRSHPESARIIREARQAAGLTQLELAEKLGVTIGTIGYYERGAGMPKTDNLFALCDILHIRPARPPARRFINLTPPPVFPPAGALLQESGPLPFSGRGPLSYCNSNNRFRVFLHLPPALARPGIDMHPAGAALGMGGVLWIPSNAAREGSRVSA